jgi:triphosphoribosyl-dephospho-CoA synthase
VNAVATAYVAACLAELDALKPGNVHRHADGHGMTVADFEESARVSAPAVAAPGARIGARVLAAVQATRAAVGQNTNLGIVLLCAPLAAAAERGDVSLRAGVATVLDDLDSEDARAVFAAIALANPGGLGTVGRNDVRKAPTVSLREAMAAAAERDSVARQFALAFDDVLGFGLAAYAAARRGGADEAEATAAVYLAFLAAEPDSHVARKFGRATAEALRRDAATRVSVLAGLDAAARKAELAVWDRDLKARGLNPGATADLTVATVFAAYLSSMRDERLATSPQQ